MFSLVLMGRVCRNMKICPRYPIPKSLSSGKGLTIASLQFFLCLMFVYSSDDYAFFQRVKRKPMWALMPMRGPQMQLASKVG